MKKLFFLCISILLLLSCKEQTTDNITFTNPDNTINVIFNLSTNRTPYYLVYHQNKIVLDTSRLGIIREDADFYNDLTVIEVSGPVKISDSYTMMQGKRKAINYLANQYTVKLQNENNDQMDIVFNLSNDGIGFKYDFPQTSKKPIEIIEEKTSYKFNSLARGWLQPMSKAKSGWKNTNPSYEENYHSDIPLNSKSPIGEGWVYPALVKTNETWVHISETGLQSNYCGTRLKYNRQNNDLKITFPQIDEVFPNGKLNPNSSLPFSTPWRIMTIGSLKTISESTLGTDLAIPEIKMDKSFIKPGLASWSWALLKDESVNYETTKEFINYSSKMNWPYCLIDVNWNLNIGDEKIKELTAYAKSKNVKLLLWYNSSGSWNETIYEPKSKLLTKEDRKTVFKKMQEIGIAGLKIDFFGGDGQSMIAYYHDILVDAAKYNLLLNFHGATLPRGWQRTYPHLMTIEAIKGQEFITFAQENADMQPSHCTIIPFTRNVFDPMDFTPMVLDSIPNITRKTTAAFELALPVLYLSGIQHIAETPTGMKKMPPYVLDFLKEIPTDWTDSKFIDGFPGKDIIIARKKNDTWYVVGINGEDTSKEFQIDLSFIYKQNGILIKDGENGLFDLEKISLSESSQKNIRLKPYGGFVMKF